jgi:hypothetical protein
MRALQIFLSALLLNASAAFAAPEDEVRAAFERFVQVQNAHDTATLRQLLVDSPDFLWITRGNVVWGHEAAMKRFTGLHAGTWKLEPELASLRVTMMGDGVAQLHVPVMFTVGSKGQAPEMLKMFLNQVLVKKGSAWQVMSIFPLPAP